MSLEEYLRIYFISREKELMPEEWNTAIIRPWFLKGNKLECEIYWGIYLLDAAYETFTDILTSIEVDLCKIAALIFIYLQLKILQKSQEYIIRFHQLYIEFKEPFDCVGRFPIIEAKKKFCEPAMLTSYQNYIHKDIQ
jgi:hypothetical protein